MTTRSGRWRRTATRARALISFATVLLSACGGESASVEAGLKSPPSPVSREVYAERLASEAGSEARVSSLLEVAAQARATIRHRMSRLAEEIAAAEASASGSGGSEAGSALEEVTSRLLLEHPADVASLLGQYRTENERAARFVDEHELITLPPGELEVVELQNPILRTVFPLALYLDGKLAVTTSATADPEPSYLRNHCLVCIPPLAVHEAFPGHHVAFHLMGSTAPGAAGADAAGTSDALRAAFPVGEYRRFLVEGWGLYAELLMLEQGYYETPERELGAWRMVLLRAVRAWVDPSLHGGDISEPEAIDLYDQELQMSREAAETEVRRHLAEPVMKASYLAGLLQLLDLRAQLREREPELDLRTFHDRLLRGAGAMPNATIPEIARQVFAVELAPLGETRPVELLVDDGASR